MIYTPQQIFYVDQLEEDKMCGYVAHMGEKRIAYRVYVGKPEVKRPLGRPTHRWEDIKYILRNRMGWHRLVHKAQDRD
jgi:hypothetical protein